MATEILKIKADNAGRPIIQLQDRHKCLFDTGAYTGIVDIRFKSMFGNFEILGAVKLGGLGGPGVPSFLLKYKDFVLPGVNNKLTLHNIEFMTANDFDYAAILPPHPFSRYFISYVMDSIQLELWDPNGYCM